MDLSDLPRPIDDAAISRALVPVRGQESFVRRSFWRKVRRNLDRVPFLDRAIAAYFAAVDPRTPAYAKAVLFAALAYFVIPTDLIPDFISGAGFTDDLSVLLAVLQTFAPHVGEHHHELARSWLHDNR